MKTYADRHEEESEIKRKKDIYSSKKLQRQMNAAAIQRKTEISQPGDHSEMQADEVGESFVNGNIGHGEHVLSQHANGISRMGEGDGGMHTSETFDHELESTKGQGRQLDEGIKSELEEHTGKDLSDVKVHTGDKSDKLNTDVGALAFTKGNDVHFGSGQYDPNSEAGKKLIAHEVSHTVQQGEGMVSRQQTGPVTDYNDRGLGGYITLDAVSATSYYEELINAYFDSGPAHYMSTGQDNQEFLYHDRGLSDTETRVENTTLYENAWRSIPLKTVPANPLDAENVADIDVESDTHKTIKLDLVRTVEVKDSTPVQVPYTAYYDLFYGKPTSVGGKPLFAATFLREETIGKEPIKGSDFTNAPMTGKKGKKQFDKYLSGVNQRMIEGYKRQKKEFYPGEYEYVPLDSYYDFTFPSEKGTTTHQIEYFKEGGLGANDKKLLLNFVNTKMRDYQQANLQVLKTNRPSSKDDAPARQSKEDAINALKENKVDEVIDCNGTSYSIQVKFSRVTDDRTEVKTDAIQVYRLGSTANIVKGNKVESILTAEDYQLEKLIKTYKADKVEVSGLDSVDDKREKIQILKYAYSLVKDKKLTDTHIDTVMNVTDKADKKNIITSMVYYSFTIEKADVNGIIHVDIKRIGKKGDAGVGDAEKLRIQDFYEYDPLWDAATLAKEIHKRYSSISEASISDPDKNVVLSNAQKLLDAGAVTKKWFRDNYKINILDKGEKGKDGRDPEKVLTEIWSYDHFTKDHKQNPQLKIENKHEVDDILDWASTELQYLEMAFQKISKPVLVKLKNVDYFRQKQHLQFDSYKGASGYTQSISDHSRLTVIIYNNGFYYVDNDGNILSNRQDYTFKGDSNDVSSDSVETILHETGHAIQYTEGNGAAFTYFYKSILKPGVESEGETKYARDHKATEFFPESFKLFTSDPVFMYNNRPKIFMWFTYLRVKGYAPSASTSSAFVKWYDKQVAVSKPSMIDLKNHIAALK